MDSRTGTLLRKAQDEQQAFNALTAGSASTSAGSAISSSASTHVTYVSIADTSTPAVTSTEPRSHC